MNNKTDRLLKGVDIGAAGACLCESHGFRTNQYCAELSGRSRGGSATFDLFKGHVLIVITVLTCYQVRVAEHSSPLKSVKT